MPSDKLSNTPHSFALSMLHCLVAAMLFAVPAVQAQTDVLTADTASVNTPKPETAAHANPASNPASQPQPGYGFAPTVKALLEADAQKALNQALGKKHQEAPELVHEAHPPAQTAPSPSAAKPPQAPRQQIALLGIYGRPGVWSADVAINGVSVLLAKGQSYLGWTVETLDGRCVALRSSKDKRTLCGARNSRP